MGRSKQPYQNCIAFFSSFSLALFITIGLWLNPLSLFAQESSTDEISTSEITDSEITIDDINTVARELWCPLCSGVRLDTCELQACDQMREQIGLQLADGASTEQIKTYFIEQYGPQVLGEPPRSGFNWLAWAVPVFALLAGALLVLQRGRYLFSSRDRASEESVDHRSPTIDPDVQPNDRNEVAASTSSPDTASTDTALPENDRDKTLPQSERYIDALDKELEAYE